MEFLNKAIEFVMGLLGKIEGWIGYALKVLGFAKDNFPQLIDIIEPLVEAEQPAVDAAPEDQKEVAKATARENVVANAKEILHASPRFVPEPIIRIVMEAVYYSKKFMSSNGTYYDEKETMDHATEWLKTWGGHGK